jgi:hypothetical protein
LSRKAGKAYLYSYVRISDLCLLRSEALVRKILFLTETAVPVKKGCWSAGSEKDEVSFEAFFVDGSSAFERGEDGAFGLREPKAGFNERVDHERSIDGNQELFKTSVLKRGDKIVSRSLERWASSWGGTRSTLFKTWMTGLVETASWAKTFST